MDAKDLIQLIHDTGYEAFNYGGWVAVRTTNPAAAAIAIAETAYDNDIFEEAMPALRTVEGAHLGNNSLLYFTDVRWEDDES